MKKLGQWQYPVTRDETLEFVSWRLDEDRVNSIAAYGVRQRATVNQVLLAALYLALRELLPHSSDRPLALWNNVDFRRYLPENTASALCNLHGSSLIAIDPRPGTSLDIVVQQIRDQTKSQQKYLGLPASLFAYDVYPILRHLVGLIPYGHLKRVAKRAMEANQKRLESSVSGIQVPGTILLTNVGELDRDLLVFGGTETIDAHTTAGVFKVPGLLGLTVSGFRGSLTLYFGVGPKALVSGVFERMMQILPARQAVSTSPSPP
jgi:NRPS condensation-like uncharacterized protein